MDTRSVSHFRVVGLDTVLQYKDRRPKWIKLENKLMSDYDFTSLTDAAKAHLILIRLLAAVNENKLPTDPEWIGRQISAHGPVNLDGLFAQGFIEEWTEDEEKF